MPLLAVSSSRWQPTALLAPILSTHGGITGFLSNSPTPQSYPPITQYAPVLVAPIQITVIAPAVPLPVAPCPLHAFAALGVAQPVAHSRTVFP